MKKILFGLVISMLSGCGDWASTAEFEAAKEACAPFNGLTSIYIPPGHDTVYAYCKDGKSVQLENPTRKSK